MPAIGCSRSTTCGGTPSTGTPGLDPAYPYTASPSPLPATLAGNGCTVTNNYPGNQLTDVASPLFTLDDQTQIQADVTAAANMGWPGSR